MAASDACRLSVFLVVLVEATETGWNDAEELQDVALEEARWEFVFRRAQTRT